MPSIEEIIRNVDTNVQDVTELRVFRLRYADPSEMASVLASLFPDDTKTTDTSRGQGRFGGGPFGGFNQAAAASDTSATAKKKTRVLAVADARTSSVIVSAAHGLMAQIEQMVEQLDNNPARKQKVFVYDLENADPVQVQDVLRNLFENSQNQNRNRTTTTQTSALSTRSANSQNSTTSGSRTGGSALGTGAGNGGGGGGGIGRGN
jgi:type II secretory pathway component GspD/PulD (secretin)